MTEKSNKGRKILAIMMALTLFASVTAVPQSTYAAAKKSKAKYSITVHNINSNTVLRKGAKLKISYTAVKKTGGKTKGAKVRFKSSKKKVASVSKKGVIKAKKKGTAYITVYCKAKPGKKKKIKIRVGNPVSSIKVSGSRYLRGGRSSTLKATVNSGATNKEVHWWSDNPGVASVSASGKVTGLGNGVCTVYATAKDGSGVSGSRKVYVHNYTSGEAKWIAHRGLHTSAVENTAAAFTAAGSSGGFWGCECDIWETRHETFSEVLPEKPASMQSQSADLVVTEETEDVSEEDPDSMLNAAKTDSSVDSVVNQIKGLGLTGSETMLEAVAMKADINAAKASYDELDQEQKYQVRLGLQSGEGSEKTEGLKFLLDAVSKIKEYDSIDLVINHDATFASIWGNGNSVRAMSKAEIRSQLPGVCFLGEYLDICKRYNMVPVIEFKDPYMSSVAVNKALDMVKEKGLLNKAYLISFYANVLADAKAQAKTKPGGTEAKTYYLISSNGASNVDLANQCRFTGVSLSKSLIDSNLYSRARGYNLDVGTWTYKDKISDDEKLYKHMFSYGWRLDFVTVDYRIFR